MGYRRWAIGTYTIILKIYPLHLKNKEFRKTVISPHCRSGFLIRQNGVALLQLIGINYKKAVG
jgi:hypothetical protein